jgi:hypothetical protein
MDVATNNQTLTVINGPPFFPPSGQVELSITRLLLRVPGGPSLLTVVQTDTDLVTGLPGPPFGGSVDHTFSLPAASAGPITLTSPADLGFFTQAGAVNLFTGGSFQARGLSPDVGPVGTPRPGTADVTVRVDYTFTPIPEPTTLALLGIGAACLVGCGLRRRRLAATC